MTAKTNVILILINQVGVIIMQKHRKTKRLQNKASNKQLQAIAKRNKHKMLLGLLNFNSFSQ